MVGDLLASLTDGDRLAALAADVNSPALLLFPAHLPLQGLLNNRQLLDWLTHHLQLLNGTLCYLKGLRRTVMGLQLLHSLFTQSDNMHLLSLVHHLTLQHTYSVDLRGLIHHITLSDQRHIVHVP